MTATTMLPGSALLSAGQAAVLPAEQVLSMLQSGPDGLAQQQADWRLRVLGPNAVRTHHVRPLAVLGRQFRSAILILLLVTASVAFLLGDRTDALIIGVILAGSVGLSFVNELRAEQAADALHSGVVHTAVVLRQGMIEVVEVTRLVPGDVVRLTLGQLVPADLRLIEVSGLECDESADRGVRWG